jgi:hypothetical protein
MSSAAAEDLSDDEEMVAMSDVHKQPTRENPIKKRLRPAP